MSWPISPSVLIGQIPARKFICLAPAYDLLNVSIVNPDDNEELALTLGGKKRKHKPEQFLEFGLGLGLTEKQIKNSYKRFRKRKDIAIAWLDGSFLSDAYKSAYKEILGNRYAILEI